MESVYSEKTLEHTRAEIGLEVRPQLKRSYRKISKSFDTHLMVEALVTLGYPIERYLNAVKPAEDFAGGLPKIFARMRRAFYQNRNEFMRLRPILQGRLENMDAKILNAIAAHAENFAPLWMTQQKAEGALEVLKGMM